MNLTTTRASVKLTTLQSDYPETECFVSSATEGVQSTVGTPWYNGRDYGCSRLPDQYVQKCLRKGWSKSNAIRIFLCEQPRTSAVSCHRDMTSSLRAVQRQPSQQLTVCL